MTGTDSASTLPLQDRSHAPGGPFSHDRFTFDAEFFVEWQVADIPPVSGFAGPWEK